ncbi:hypothetical protein F0562_002403 [Nyssa sinensis]|uniref:Leucine-rich repeat-containing N-terminal plant-type domain-containing protein n=1 Tax=Nyssa sinensis TaxID=561372 RepID=A0A5J5C665_9ASTE|nr:hypothetical protein F0562_002403 [Nyssa sinensis]
MLRGETHQSRFCETKHIKVDSIASSVRTEAEALVEWKDGLSSSFLNSWSLTNNGNLCNWTGIVCNTDGSISEINLSDANLTGTLTHFSFTSFPNLTRFDLNYNNLNESIPSTIGNLSNLTFLDLSINLFDGNIPREIGQLTELRYLGFFNNFLNGTIPYQVCNLQKVWYLDLGSNYLETPDWSKFSGMPLLTHLSFYLNELTLEFPDFIPNCWNLTYLDLSLNHFTGPIPESVFTNLGKLEYLNLTDNSFQGSLSLKISKLSKLKDLRLASNNFTG